MNMDNILLAEWESHTERNGSISSALRLTRRRMSLMRSPERSEDCREFLQKLFIPILVEKAMYKTLVDNLEKERQIGREHLEILLLFNDRGTIHSLMQRAAKTTQSHYGNHINIRGMIEFTNYCHNFKMGETSFNKYKNDQIFCDIKILNRLKEQKT